MKDGIVTDTYEARVLIDSILHFADEHGYCDCCSRWYNYGPTLFPFPCRPYDVAGSQHVVRLRRCSERYAHGGGL